MAGVLILKPGAHYTYVGWYAQSAIKAFVRVLLGILFLGRYFGAGGH